MPRRYGLLLLTAGLLVLVAGGATLVYADTQSGGCFMVVPMERSGPGQPWHPASGQIGTCATNSSACQAEEGGDPNMYCYCREHVVGARPNPLPGNPSNTDFYYSCICHCFYDLGPGEGMLDLGWPDTNADCQLCNVRDDANPSIIRGVECYDDDSPCPPEQDCAWDVTDIQGNTGTGRCKCK